jgi:hypothetical protein
MAYSPHRFGYTSPDEETKPLKRLSLVESSLASPSTYAPPYTPQATYELEKSPFVDTVEPEAKVGWQPTPPGRRKTRHRMSWESLEESWDQAVQVGWWPRVIYAVIGVLFVIIWMIVTQVPQTFLVSPLS